MLPTATFQRLRTAVAGLALATTVAACGSSPGSPAAGSAAGSAPAAASPPAASAQPSASASPSPASVGNGSTGLGGSVGSTTPSAAPVDASKAFLTRMQRGDF